MELPPVIALVIANLRQIILPPAVALCGIKLWQSLFDLTISTWLQLPLCVASFPLALFCTVSYTDFRDKRQAATNGAILAPRVLSRWPGGLDLLLASVKNIHSGYMGEVFEQWFSAFGNTVTVPMLWENRIFTTEPEHVKAILATNFNTFEKGPIAHRITHTLLGTGVFNSDGDVWKFHRSMTRPFFTRDRISDLEIFEKHASDAIEQLKTRMKQGYPADFQDMVSRFTLDSATEFLFGKNVCSLGAGLVYPPSSPLSDNVEFDNHPANRFAHAFLEAQIQTAYRSRAGKHWELFEVWGNRVKKHMYVCREFIDPILEEALSKKKALREAGIVPEKAEEVMEGETLLDHLVNYTEDHTIIRDEILNIMIAGRDTTAAALTCAIWMLSQHPDVLEKLRAEILTTVGSSSVPTLENMRDMKYMRAVINETLRLYPPVPFNVRTSTTQVVLPAAKGKQPIYVPANTRVLYSVFLMHRRKDLWGPDADQFDPNRFLDERAGKYLTHNPFIFLPFNGGPRICLGQQFAYNEISYFLVRLLQRFSSIRLAEDVQTLAPAEWAKAPGRKGVEKAILRSHLTVYVHEGLWVRMDEADSTEVQS